MPRNPTPQKIAKRQADMAEALTMLRLLSHPLRLSILCAIVENGEMSAGDIVAAHAGTASQSQISQYLGNLRESGILTARRTGQFIHYRLGDRRAARLLDTLKDLYCPDQGPGR